MFEEIEKVASENNNRGNNNYSENNVSKLFEINGLTNKDIGKKIKSFSKFFLIFQAVIYAVAAFIMLFICLDAGEEGIIAWILMMLGFGVAFVFSYYGFLLVSGFGALVEDMNTLKTISARGDSKFSKKEKYEDLPKL